jgi:hypothetical protein
MQVAAVVLLLVLQVVQVELEAEEQAVKGRQILRLLVLLEVLTQAEAEAEAGKVPSVQAVLVVQVLSYFVTLILTQQHFLVELLKQLQQAESTKSQRLRQQACQIQ